MVVELHKAIVQSKCLDGVKSGRGTYNHWQPEVVCHGLSGDCLSKILTIPIFANGLTVAMLTAFHNIIFPHFSSHDFPCCSTRTPDYK